MKKILCAVLVMVILLTGCSSGGSDNEKQSAQGANIEITLNGEAIILANPPLLRKDVVYVTANDMATLPGIEIDYNPATSEVTAKRGENVLTMKIGQPLKAGDKNGPVPFLEKDMVYIPFCDALGWLNYKAETTTAAGGTLAITLEKFGFDYEDYLKMVTGAKFNADELKAAETALSKGVTIGDPQNDWAPISEGIQEDGRKDNAHPYPIDFTDVKSVTFGVDNQYLYLRYEFYGILPEKLPYHENTDLGQTDFITGIGANFNFDSFFNRNTGKDDAGGMQISICWVQKDGKEYTDNPTLFAVPVINIQNMATVTDQKYENGDDVYSVSNNHGRCAGGAGTNYLLGAFPLAEYGLQPGDTVEASMGIEVNSKIFHHASIDVVLDCGYKAGSSIRYRLGGNTYEDIGPAGNLIPLDGAATGK